MCLQYSRCPFAATVVTQESMEPFKTVRVSGGTLSGFCRARRQHNKDSESTEMDSDGIPFMWEFLALVADVLPQRCAVYRSRTRSSRYPLPCFAMSSVRSRTRVVVISMIRWPLPLACSMIRRTSRWSVGCRMSLTGCIELI